MGVMSASIQTDRMNKRPREEEQQDDNLNKRLNPADGRNSDEMIDYEGSDDESDDWTQEEDARLISAMERIQQNEEGTVCWSDVSDSVAVKSPVECYRRWRALLKHKSDDEIYTDICNKSEHENCEKSGEKTWDKTRASRRGWTEEEDERLRAAVLKHERKGGGVYWGRVSDELGDRTYRQCLKRWKQTLQHEGTQARTCSWSGEEDGRLLEAMTLYNGQGKGGGVDWTKVSEHLGGLRAPIQCYKRWHDALKQRRRCLEDDSWTTDDDNRVIEGVKIYAGEGIGGGVNWSAVATHVGATKTSKDCNRRWNKVLKLQRGVACVRTDPWGEDEDEALCRGVQQYSGSQGTVDWLRVSEDHLGGQRTPKQCAHRIEVIQKQRQSEEGDLRGSSTDGNSTPLRQSIQRERLDRGRARAGPWSGEDDERLAEAVRSCEGQGRGGGIDWSKVAECMVGRTSEQCRLRWNTVLRVHRSRGTTVKTGPWAKHEDERLIQAVGLYEGQGKGGGVDWRRVSEYCNGERTPNQCHTRWNSVLRHRGEGLKTTPWTDAEDALLTEAVAMYDGVGRGGTVDWAKVREHVGSDRSTYQHRMRWHSVLKNRVNGSSSRGTSNASNTHRKEGCEPWTETEIVLLMESVKCCSCDSTRQPGDIQQSKTDVPTGEHHELPSVSSTDQELWDKVAAELGDRMKVLGMSPSKTSIQCLHMWRQILTANERAAADGDDSFEFGPVGSVCAPLDPKNQPWTVAEDEKLIGAVGVFDGQGRGGGVDWKKVCEYMGSVRTYNQCRHRWHNVLKQRDVMGSTPSSSDFGIHPPPHIQPHSHVHNTQNLCVMPSPPIRATPLSPTPISPESSLPVPPWVQTMPGVVTHPHQEKSIGGTHIQNHVQIPMLTVAAPMGVSISMPMSSSDPYRDILQQQRQDESQGVPVTNMTVEDEYDLSKYDV